MEHATPPILLLFALFAAFILYHIRRARQGRAVHLRKIPGLEVIDEVVGQATEQDRPILFNPGMEGLGVDLFCSLAVMGHVVRRAARLSMPVHVPLSDPLACAMAEEYWKDGYASVGREGLFAAEDHLRYMTNNQSAYAAAVAGWIKRERVAASFLFGNYGYEALILAEAGQQAGAVQVACTPSFFQVPFFMVSCDYTVFGEEFYAAGAYFSRDPVLTGSLVGQDWAKLVLLVLIVAGVVVYSITQQDWLSVLLQN
jgi:hypothetical protein